MPFEPGGLADKLGNRYEGQWVASKLLSLLNEKIKSVTIEAIGDDERGVDLWVEQKDGTRQAHQCKARNASKEHWTIGDLAGRGILGHLKFQLDRAPTHKFFFVSSVGSGLFNDICDYARRSNSDPNLFYQEKICTAGKDVKTCFEQFCRHLSLNPTEQTDLVSAFSYLRRTYINVYPDDHGTRQFLLGQADYLLLSVPEVAISTLLTYAENNDRFGSPIYVDELRNYLIGVDIHPKRLEHDARIAPAIQELQKQFAASIQPGLIGGELLKREETRLLIEAIDNGESVILSGSAGYGKSGVLFELTEYLKKENIPYLPVRLDRREPQNTATQFGQQMGLPDCPAYSLDALAGERKSVLILDQLDAIRWTSAHSKNALDVCQELVAHVEMLRRNGRAITIVLSCRTFDLEHDPSIRNWLSGSKYTNVTVKGLADDVLQEIIGPAYLQMSGKVKSLLSVPLNLSIWVELSRSGDVPPFNTSTDLIREFWKRKRLDLEVEAGFPTDKVNQVLFPLVDFMEQNGKISAPERVVTDWPLTVKALRSYGVLQQSSKEISFCHQRYLDYLIADRLLQQIYAGSGSVLEWLGGREKQSLFRREQLRQALTMLAEENPQKFLTTAQALLGADSVRFHVKHLILELVGAQEEVSEALGEYCLNLFQEEYWRDHIFDTVFWGSQNYFQFLSSKGVIKAWLESDDEESVGRSLGLLRSVAEKIPDDVTAILEPYAEQGGEWPGRILGSLAWSVKDDSDRMFLLRLKLISLGTVRDFVDWKSLCSHYPLRSIRLIEAVLATWQVDSGEQEVKRRNRIEKWYDQDCEALSKVAENHPEETWRLLVPHIERLTAFEENPYDQWQRQWREPRFSAHTEIGIARGVVDLVVVAGKKLAKAKPEFLLKQTVPLENSTSPVIREILIEIYSDLPADYADIGIAWLLGDSSRFALGAGLNEPQWEPAVRLIESLSPFCSEELFSDLEKSIIHYHSPDEKRDAEYALNGWRRGHFYHYWGEAQYFLLPALPADRMRKSTADLIRVLQRKFDDCSEDRFLRIGRSMGGLVSSKLDPVLGRLTDRTWLKIIGSEKVGPCDNRKWIQVSSDQVLTTSISQFSGSMRSAAKKNPERFGQLALRFPDDVHVDYVAAVMEGFSLIEPGTDLSEEERKTWRPARVETIEAVLEKFTAGDDRETAIAFCRMISSRAQEQWSNSVLERLVWFAQTHPDLEPEKLNIHCDKTASEASVENLFQNTINCVRGVAAGAIGRLLRENEELLDKLCLGIDSLVRDPHPAVKMAAAEMLLPVLNIEEDQAVEWFCVACKDDLRIAASPGAMLFYNHTMPKHVDRLGPVIKEMVASHSDEVAKEGARQVAGRWLLSGVFEDELRMCQTGSVPQRQGVASVASQLLRERSCYESCESLIRPLLNDPEKEVRDELRGLFRKTDLYSDPHNESLIADYLNSATFADDPDLFLWGIKDVPGSVLFMAETIFRMFEAFCSKLREDSRDMQTSLPHAISEVIPVLLRLYEQALAAENAEIASRCLDIWDALFENRVGVARDLTIAIEK
ncbi:MAG: hypothetical protein KAT62_11285 [Desulfuromonadales bacterium]|nr:hypothetical protein [Desulfuromonadales bacterium]